MIDNKPLTPEAIDRIIDAVEHFGDDPDPVQQALNYAWNDFVHIMLDAWKAEHGEWPIGKATLTLTMDDTTIKTKTVF